MLSLDNKYVKSPFFFRMQCGNQKCSQQLQGQETIVWEVATFHRMC